MNTREQMTKESALRLKKALESAGNLKYFLNIYEEADEVRFMDGCLYCYERVEGQYYPHVEIIDDKKIVKFILKERTFKTGGLKNSYQRRLLWKAVNTALGEEESIINKVEEDYQEEYEDYEMEEN